MDLAELHGNSEASMYDGDEVKLSEKVINMELFN